MAFSFINRCEESYPAAMKPIESIQKRLEEWQQKVLPFTNSKIGFAPISVQHNWHGNKSDRAYVERWKILLEENFNPTEDLTYNKDGVMEFSNSGKRFEAKLADYFIARKEDNN